jgi:hypothetical protein
MRLDSARAGRKSAAPMTTSDRPDDTEDEGGARAAGNDDHGPRLWKGSGWTARVVKNEDDDGWAVSMTSDGESEPALVGPWTMGRDKKNPKPLDASAFTTLVKTANEILARHEQQRRALLHRSVTVGDRGSRLRVDLDVVPDEDDPHALLSATDEAGEVVARSRVEASFKLTTDSARRWLVGALPDA